MLINKYMVSFCIPVYNNAKVAVQIAENLLHNTDERFQVVFSDDYSTDDTLKKLLEIEDERLKICSNQLGKGAKLNWCNALENGDGTYLYLVMGRDRLNSDKIGYLIEKLMWANANNIVCALDRPTREEQFSPGQGYGRLLGMLHPTGTIFRRKEYRDIKDRKKVFLTKDAYPENHIKGRLIRLYSSAYINGKVFINQVFVNKRTTVSSFETDKKIQYFYPERRIQQTINMIRIFSRDEKLSNDELCNFTLQKCDCLMEEITTVWKKNLKDASWCGHYAIEMRKVKKGEEIINVIKGVIAIIYYVKDYSWYTLKLALNISVIGIKQIIREIQL